jgi:hypothetical protein
MPIEIKELHIRVAVNASPSGQSLDTQAASSSSDANGDTDKEAIVAECVEQVLRILQSKQER